MSRSHRHIEIGGLLALCLVACVDLAPPPTLGQEPMAEVPMPGVPTRPDGGPAASVADPADAAADESPPRSNDAGMAPRLDAASPADAAPARDAPSGDAPPMKEDAPPVDAVAAADKAPSPTEPRSCKELHAQKPALPTGVHMIDPDGAGGDAPFAAYCDMTAGGGGWTLLLKTDGRTRTFTYASPVWTNQELVNPASLDLKATDAKLAAAVALPFTELRVGLAPSATDAIRWLEVSVSAPSLVALVSAKGQLLAPPAGRAAWLGLLNGAKLQANCNREGFNIGGPTNHAQIRIGLLGNNEADCILPDSWIGIGGSELPARCGYAPTTATTGNIVVCPDSGSAFTNTAAFGFVMGR